VDSEGTKVYSGIVSVVNAAILIASEDRHILAGNECLCFDRLPRLFGVRADVAT